MDELVSFQILVRGQVQGVGYRYFARQRAELHGVRGFVRNLPDGSVEVRAEGLAPAMAAFEAELKAGPQFGRVESADVIPTKARGYEQFEIR